MTLDPIQAGVPLADDHFGDKRQRFAREDDERTQIVKFALVANSAGLAGSFGFVGTLIARSKDGSYPEIYLWLVLVFVFGLCLASIAQALKFWTANKILRVNLDDPVLGTYVSHAVDMTEATAQEADVVQDVRRIRKKETLLALLSLCIFFSGLLFAISAIAQRAQ